MNFEQTRLGAVADLDTALRKYQSGEMSGLSCFGARGHALTRAVLAIATACGTALEPTMMLPNGSFMLIDVNAGKPQGGFSEQFRRLLEQHCPNVPVLPQGSGFLLVKVEDVQLFVRNAHLEEPVVA